MRVDRAGCDCRAGCEEDIRALTIASMICRPAFPLRVIRCLHPAPVGVHTHEFTEIVYVIRGAGRHEVGPVPGKGYEDPSTGGRTSYGIMEGDIFCIAPGECHGYSANERLEIYNLLFSPELLIDDLPILRRVPGLFDFMVVEPTFRRESGFGFKLRLAPVLRERLERCLRRLERELEQEAPGYEAAAKGLLLEILVLVGRAYAGMPLSTSTDLTAKRTAIHKAIAYIERHYADTLSLEDLSSRALLSPSYFCQRFRKATGLSPWDYVTRVRLDHAKMLLAQTDRTVTDIALSVGFGDSGYFARVFKAREGMSPREYRKSQQIERFS